MEINYSYYATSKGYKVVGGTAAQFLKANGSVDSNIYWDNNTLTKDEFVKNVISNTDADLVSETSFSYGVMNMPAFFPYDKSGTLLHKQFNGAYATQLAMSYHGSTLAFRSKTGGVWGAWEQSATQNWVFSEFIPKSHPVFNVTQSEINTWTQFYNWGNHADAGYWDNNTLTKDEFVKNVISNTDADLVSETSFSYGVLNMPVFFPGDKSGTLLHKQFNSAYATQLAMSYHGSMLAFRSKTGGVWGAWEQSVSQNWVTQQSYLTVADLNGYATQSWVQSLGYITASALNGYATQNWVSQQSYLTAADLNGYATQAWVQSLGYITASALNGYATQSYVGQNYIPQTHPVNNVTQTNINTWNNLASYAHQHSNYSLLEVINQELATNSEVDFARVIVEDYVKAQNNFMSANEEPDTMFIPDGNTATLRDEIINDDYQIRLNPHEYNVDGSGYLEIIDRNRLIHVIGEQIKMVVNLKEVFSKQEFVIYNFDPAGNSMTIQVQGNNVASIDPGCFRRFYVTEALRVIAEREQPCDFIW
jgi:hypothetical protein